MPNEAPISKIVNDALYDRSGPLPSTDVTGSSDTTTIQALFDAAAAEGKTVRITHDAVYSIDSTIHVRVPYRFGPNTVMKAAPGFTDVLFDTPEGMLVSNCQFYGGVFDSNGTARHAFWAHHITHCTFDGSPVFRNSAQDDLVIGDPTEAGYSYGTKILTAQFDRTVGGKKIGYSHLWLTDHCTDSIVTYPRGNGQETGIRTDGGDNKFFSPHMSNAMLTSYFDNGSGNEWIGPTCDTMGQVAHTDATGASGTSTITDPAIALTHSGLPVSGNGVPTAPACFVGDPVPGAGFTLVSATGAPVSTTGVVAGLVLHGVGLNLQGDRARVVAGYSLMSNTIGTDNTSYAICIGSRVSFCTILGHSVNGLDSGHRFIAALVGKTGFAAWFQLLQKNCVNTYPLTQVAVTTTIVSASGSGSATAATRYVGGTGSGAPTSGRFSKGDFVIDQSGAIWICVGAGDPGTWVNPAGDPPAYSALDDGLAAINMDPMCAGSASATLVSGTLYSARLRAAASKAIARVLVGIEATAEFTVGQCFVGVYDSVGTLIGSSEDMSRTLATGQNLIPLTAAAGQSLAVTGGQTYHVVVLLNYTEGTPTLLASANNVTPNGGGVVPTRFMTLGAGRTALPDNFTPSSGTGTVSWPFLAGLQ